MSAPSMTYRVHTDHYGRLELCFINEPVTVYPCYEGGYVAEHELLGMSKRYPTAREAVTRLLTDAGCTVLHLHAQLSVAYSPNATRIETQEIDA